MLRFLHSKTWIATFVSIILLAACTSSSSNVQTVQPTALPTLTTIPFYNFVQPTLPPQLQTIAAATAAAASAGTTTPSVLELGQKVYLALQCNSCHGDKGEGTSKGSALTSFALSENDFISEMHSGGKMGSSHAYPVDRLNDSDGKNLYEYLKSLTIQ